MISSQNQSSLSHKVKDEETQEIECHDKENRDKNETEEFIIASVSGGSPEWNDTNKLEGFPRKIGKANDNEEH